MSLKNNEKGRIGFSIQNIFFGVVGQIAIIVFQFACRTVFIKTLATEYLGVNGLFTNILSVLSLAELGFGTAMNYSMYKPVAENDIEKIIKYVNLYKIFYRIAAAVIVCIGLCLIPFLDVLIADQPNIDNLTIIYILYLFNTVFSYLMIYKKAVIQANQKEYVCTIYTKAVAVIQNIVQMIALVVTHNFILYLGIQVFCSVLTNFLISKKAERMYPYLAGKLAGLPEKDELKQIGKNTLAMSMHRVGGVVVNGTDNLIISAFVGLTQVGLYSNYTLITSNLNTFLSIIFNSLTASIGNLGAKEKETKIYDTFRMLDFAGFWLISFCSTCLIVLFNPFFSLWVGNSYVFDMTIVISIVLVFYFNGTRKVTLLFRDAMGIFWYDRYKPIFEAIINLVVSIVLVKSMGIVGVFIGTIVSTLTTSLWVEPYVLYKWGFKKSVLPHMAKLAVYFSFWVICCGGIYYLMSFLPNTWLMFIIRGIAIVFFYNICIFVVFGRTKAFKGMLKIIHRKLKIPRRKRI